MTAHAQDAGSLDRPVNLNAARVCESCRRRPATVLTVFDDKAEFAVCRPCSAASPAESATGGPR